jgi:hypothetical protein
VGHFGGMLLPMQPAVTAEAMAKKQKTGIASSSQNRREVVT